MLLLQGDTTSVGHPRVMSCHVLLLKSNALNEEGGGGGGGVVVWGGGGYLSIVAPLSRSSSYGRNGDLAGHLILPTPVQASDQVNSVCTHFDSIATAHRNSPRLIWHKPV